MSYWKVTADLRGLKSLTEALKADLRFTKNRPVKTALTASATEVEKYLKRRYIRNAAGRGEWAPLEENTIIRKKGDHRILIRDGDLIRALSAKMTRKGFFVGFLIDRTHISQRVSIRRLAEIHTKIGVGHKFTTRQVMPTKIPKSVVDRMVKRIKKGYQNAFDNPGK
jgi:hypothetical protein